MGTVMHSCEGEIVCMSVNPKIPYFNAPIYLENKSVVGKVDEILGPMNQVYFTVKPQEGIVASSFKEGDKMYIGGDKLLPLERFLPKPKAPAGMVERLLFPPRLLTVLKVPRLRSAAVRREEDAAPPGVAEAVSHREDGVARAAVPAVRGVEAVADLGEDLLLGDVVVAGSLLAVAVVPGEDAVAIKCSRMGFLHKIELRRLLLVNRCEIHTHSMNLSPRPYRLAHHSKVPWIS
jgi:rRNA processing protein Gar1